MNKEPNNKPAKRVKLADLWADIDNDTPHEEWLHHKREDAAIVLTSLLNKVGISRAALARKLAWKPSRVTRALSGNENLTLNTMAEIINAIGMDFDILIRKRGEVRALQPWERAEIMPHILEIHQMTVRNHEQSEANLNKSMAMLHSIQVINRMSFRQGTKKPRSATTTLNFTYEEDSDARIACQA